MLKIFQERKIFSGISVLKTNLIFKIVLTIQSFEQNIQGFAGNSKLMNCVCNIIDEYIHVL